MYLIDIFPWLGKGDNLLSEAISCPLRVSFFLPGIKMKNRNSKIMFLRDFRFKPGLWKKATFESTISWYVF